MPKFVIEEDMARSTGIMLKEHGYDVKDIRDHGLRGAEDKEIYADYGYKPPGSRNI